MIANWKLYCSSEQKERNLHSNWDGCQEDDDLINQTFDQEGSQRHGISGE